MRLNKQTLYGLFLVALIYAGYKWRQYENTQLQYLKGATMGTRYNIKYLGKYSLQHEIDSILTAFSQSMSTYIPESEISVFNRTGVLKIKSKYFYPMLTKANEIYTRTDGAFDPTVMPLVNAWGFGFKNRGNTDSTQIDRLLQFVGFEKIRYTSDSVIALQPGVMLDFSAIAKGYGVDVVSAFLKSRGMLHHMVEIGGEIVCSGKNDAGRSWTIEINNPSDSLYLDERERMVRLDNKAIATSGNYLNFYVDSNGIKRAHTIDPKNGYPVGHTLLSVSVKTSDCATADGYATALMVLGPEKAKTLAMSFEDMDVLLMYDKGGILESWSSPNFYNDEEN